MSQKISATPSIDFHPESACYFDVAESSPEPYCLRGLSWEEVKAIIRKAVREYLG